MINQSTKELKKCCLDCGVFLYRIYARLDGNISGIGWFCPICFKVHWDKDLGKELKPEKKD